MKKDFDERLKSINWGLVYLLIFGGIWLFMLVAVALYGKDYVTGEKTDATVTEVRQLWKKSPSGKGSRHHETQLKIRYVVNGTRHDALVTLQGKARISEGDTIKIACRTESPEKIALLQQLLHDIVRCILWGAAFFIQIILLRKFRKKT